MSSLLLSKAIRFATWQHGAQVDKSGHPYILHPLRVMHSVGYENYDLMIVAVLHDVLEDTYATLGDLKNIGFSQDVVAAVVAMTRRVFYSGKLSLPAADRQYARKEPYEDFIERVSQNEMATVVKMMDIQDNTLSWRMVQLDPQAVQSMICRYHRAQQRLQAPFEKASIRLCGRIL